MSSVLHTLNLEGKTFGHLKTWIWRLGERPWLCSSAYRRQWRLHVWVNCTGKVCRVLEEKTMECWEDINCKDCGEEDKGLQKETENEQCNRTTREGPDEKPQENMFQGEGSVVSSVRCFRKTKKDKYKKLPIEHGNWEVVVILGDICGAVWAGVKLQWIEE